MVPPTLNIPASEHAAIIRSCPSTVLQPPIHCPLITEPPPDRNHTAPRVRPRSHASRSPTLMLRPAYTLHLPSALPPYLHPRAPLPPAAIRLDVPIPAYGLSNSPRPAYSSIVNSEVVHASCVRASENNLAKAFRSAAARFQQGIEFTAFSAILRRIADFTSGKYAAAIIDLSLTNVHSVAQYPSPFHRFLCKTHATRYDNVYAADISPRLSATLSTLPCGVRRTSTHATKIHIPTPRAPHGCA